MSSIESTEYEQLTEYIVTALAQVAPVTTIRIERDVVVEGRATNHQIDLLWEFRDGERRHTVLFECRSYKRPLTQSALGAWDFVVRDVAESLGSCEGVVVTTAGYQKGAKAIANTYGIVIMELRVPTERDLAGRVLEVRIDLKFRNRHTDDLRVEAIATSDEAQEGINWTLGGELYVERPGGDRRPLLHILWEGHATAHGEAPLAATRVQRAFDPPVRLFLEDEYMATIRSASATLSESVADADPIVIDGRDKLAWLLKDTLDATHVWFTKDGEHKVTS